MAIPVYTCTNSVRGFPFLYTLSSIYYFRLFNNGHLTYLRWLLLAVFFFFFFFLFFLPFYLFRVAPMAYGSSQARGWIGATDASLHHSHSNIGSKLHLQPTPQLMAMPWSIMHWAMPGIKPTSSWILFGFVDHWAIMGNLYCTFHLHFSNN